jgi:spermidine synthase/MFS family permease
MKKHDQTPILAYAITIFLSAFLLFQVQPMMGKMILPWFGGAASVWTACMLFFQSLLLLGYLYTHWVMRLLSPSRQSFLHIALLLLCLFFLPISPSESLKPQGSEDPTWLILYLLGVTIGLPYMVLSTTGPLVQAWFAKERSDVVPYRLFALSNLGSMLALLAYPLVIESALPTRMQSWMWSAFFVVFVLCCVYLSRRSLALAGASTAPSSNSQDSAEAPEAAPRLVQQLIWVALAACPSMLMVADTSFMTENIAPIPLMWVMPLALYLLTFIICFELPFLYKRVVWLPLFVLSLALLAYLPNLRMGEWPVSLSVGLNLLAFFVVCMVCHGELAGQKPNPRHLTGYYLMLSVGGFLGGFFVGVIAPYFFNSNYEYSVGLVLSAVVVLAALLGTALGMTPNWRTSAGVLGGAMSMALVWASVSHHQAKSEGVTWKARNFYGSLKMYEYGGYRRMLHGQIIHGQQYVSDDLRRRPTTYFTPASGVGLAMLAKGETGPLRVGVLGLGVGTLVAYGRAGDVYRLYEIDPLVIELAQEKFTYLSDTPAKLEIVLGDGRLQLEREPSQQFDVLVMDAFSGDSVPVHLLTLEAFQIYFKHLKHDGVLAMNVTNAFLDLVPVLKRAADHHGKHMRLLEHPGDQDLAFASRWVLITDSKDFFDQASLQAMREVEAPEGFAAWRDDYSSLLAVLKKTP